MFLIGVKILSRQFEKYFVCLHKKEKNWTRIGCFTTAWTSQITQHPISLNHISDTSICRSQFLTVWTFCNRTSVWTSVFYFKSMWLSRHSVSTFFRKEEGVGQDSGEEQQLYHHGINQLLIGSCSRPGGTWSLWNICPPSWFGSGPPHVGVSQIGMLRWLTAWTSLQLPATGYNLCGMNRPLQQLYLTPPPLVSVKWGTTFIFHPISEQVFRPEIPPTLPVFSQKIKKCDFNICL